MVRRIIIPSILCILLGFSFSISLQAESQEKILDLSQLDIGPGSIQVLESLSNETEGSIEFFHQHWLMYFLHWSPLTP